MAEALFIEIFSWSNKNFSFIWKFSVDITRAKFALEGANFQKGPSHRFFNPWLYTGYNLYEKVKSDILPFLYRVKQITIRLLIVGDKLSQKRKMSIDRKEDGWSSLQNVLILLLKVGKNLLFCFIGFYIYIHIYIIFFFNSSISYICKMFIIFHWKIIHSRQFLYVSLRRVSFRRKVGLIKSLLCKHI